MRTESKPITDDSIVLRDGRDLSFARYGADGGFPVLWFHGTPGGRFQLPPDATEQAGTRGIEIIAVDRPGVGGSTQHRDRSLLSWADDVDQLADLLGHDKFGVIGLSGGGPYALACAHELPHRVVGAATLGGVGPAFSHADAPAFGRAVHGVLRTATQFRDPLANALSYLVPPLHRLASPGFDLYARFGPKSDRSILESPKMKAMFSEDIIAATHSGMHGAIWDATLFARPWGFDLADITVPIRLWHGSADSIVPVSHSRYIVDCAADAELIIVDGMGHFAGFAQVASVLDTMLPIWVGP